MYTRSCFPENDGIKIPENYDGNAFREEKKEDPKEAQMANEAPIGMTWKAADDADEVMAKGENGQRGLGGFLDKLSPSLITKALPFFKGDKLSLGSEELLISAIALFLFFSRSGDKECAVMLLLLLWIK